MGNAKSQQVYPGLRAISAAPLLQDDILVFQEQLTAVVLSVRGHHIAELNDVIFISLHLSQTPPQTLWTPL